MSNCRTPNPVVKYDALGPYFDRDPTATLSVGFNWKSWLYQRGLLELDSSSWDSDAGTTVSGSAHEKGVTSALNSGGVLMRDYTLVNTVTAGGETDVRRIRVKVRPT